MAREKAVRDYLICWWQLGKALVHHTPAGDVLIRPQPLFQGEDPSPVVEAVWQRIRQAPQQFYLSGTNESLAELLSDRWEATACARCQLPVLIRRFGIPEGPCPCSDLDIWPSRDTLPPRTHFREELQAKLVEVKDQLAVG
ncbi:MAG: hypothetical protein Q6J68_00785 [Thermostichales cyanobacterium SZTDM-1c_bins_54]